MGVAGESAGELWRTLAAEVERLTAGRVRGRSFSEDFAVDRVCSAIAKLRQQHEMREAEEGSAEEMRSLRVELAMEEQRLRIQDSKMDDVRVQIKQAQEVKQDLQRELESEEAGRREASDGQARQWKEAAYRTHLCLNSLRSKEQELAQLQAALDQPQALAQVWDALARRLQSELDAASAEASEAKREHDRLALECSKVERDLAALDLGAPAPVGTGSGLPPQLGMPGGFGPSAERDASREELLRIAGRADGSAESLLRSAGAPPAAGAARAPLRPGLPPSSTSPRIEAPVVEPRDPLRPLAAGAPARLGAAPAGPSSTKVLDEAQRVLEKMDRLQAWRSPTSGAAAPALFH